MDSECSCGRDFEDLGIKVYIIKVGNGGSLMTFIGEQILSHHPIYHSYKHLSTFHKIHQLYIKLLDLVRLSNFFVNIYRDKNNSYNKTPVQQKNKPTTTISKSNRRVHKNFFFHLLVGKTFF